MLQRVERALAWRRPGSNRLLWRQIIRRLLLRRLCAAALAECSELLTEFAKPVEPASIDGLRTAEILTFVRAIRRAGLTAAVNALALQPPKRPVTDLFRVHDRTRGHLQLFRCASSATAWAMVSASRVAAELTPEFRWVEFWCGICRLSSRKTATRCGLASWI